MSRQSSDAIRNVVIVHGAFADGSGWAAVDQRQTLTLEQGKLRQSPACNPANSGIG